MSKRKMTIERFKKEDRFCDCCQSCGREIEQGGNYFRLEDREGEHLCCCPECAAVYLAETLDAVSREYEWIDDVRHE